MSDNNIERKLHNIEEKRQSKFEIKCGIILATFAAILAVNELGSGKFGGDEVKAINEKTSALNWYQSKSIKQNLMEGQRDFLKSLFDTGVVAKEFSSSLQNDIDNINKKIERYNKEKNEILEGSKKVGKENWTQDIDGKLGLITGANEWSEIAEKLGGAGDIFDLASLFLQLSLVLGAISIVLKDLRMKNIFFIIMCSIGVIGSTISIRAFSIALPI